ncbi:MAG TPA: hypothetical protein VFG76_04820 [Candidatus Polarisedimenticolia bacterium]|nr:hypothetical protein [Candidatus Polarisedimenticolia bacterium]
MSSQRHERPIGHEEKDVDLRRVTILGLGLAGGIVVALLLMLWTFNILAGREARRQAPAASLAQHPANALPPEPRLQSLPARDLQEMLASEEALMTSYGWVDRASGSVRIPVDRAMELTAKRGLPVRAEAKR